MRRKLKFKIEFVPYIFSFCMFIFGIPTRQYAFCFVSLFMILGFSVVWLIAVKIKFFEKHKRGTRWVKVIGFLLILSTDITFAFLARGTLNPRYSAQVWAMHEIDNPGFVLPNGLDPYDVNKDGYDDYVTNYEWDGKLRIAFHPGDVNLVKNPWPAITVGEINNAESSCFGDFDSDGNADVAVAHGQELGASSGVFIIWGPDPSSVMDSSAWIQSSDIVETQDQGQFHFIRGYDVNEDGADDIIVGGRGTDPKAGLKWIESPTNPSERRDMTKWNMHEIDAELESGHGFEFSDIDNDGDDDLVLCNSDWDTKNADEGVFWYENPGSLDVSQIDPWSKRTIYQGPEFYAKEQIATYDFSGDGYPEVIMQVIDDLYWFKNPGNLVNSSGTWELVKIPKPEHLQWRCRPVKIGDINNDTQPDILGMLMHKNGYFPRNKGAVFWMEMSSLDPQIATFEWHMIKWSDGFFGVGGKFNGEKWDMCEFRDVDRDGDLDIVANCEEFHTFGFVYIAVVWFENPLN